MNKISRPRMFGILPRLRLFHSLDEGLERPVVWVHGPGGSGKSTLVASYLESRRLASIWYQADGGDSDVASFFYYMGLAAKKAAPRYRRPLPLLTPEYQLDVETFARRYFDKLFHRLPSPFTLVLDDYHEIAPDSALHQVLKTAFAQVPQGVTIIVISRMPPPGAMARLCAGKQLSFVSWDELRLTAEETGEIVRLHAKGEQFEPAIGQLHERIQGWVAALVLLLERGKVDELGLWLEGKTSQHEIFEYFAEELFDKAAPHIREFLLKTVLLPTITPGLAQKLTGHDDAAGILAHLHETHFFTERRLQRETLYRFHPLFREFLLKKGQALFPPESLVKLKQKASLLLEESGHLEEAAALCIETDDSERLATFTLANAATLIAQGRSHTVVEWLGHLHLPLEEQTPYLLFWSGVAYISSDPQESRRRLTLAFTRFRAEGDRNGLFLSWCAVVDTAIHASQYASLGEWIETLEGVLREDPTFPSLETEVRVSLSLFNAVAFGLPNHPHIASIRDRAFSLICTETIGDANLFLSTGIHLVIYFIYQGDFTRGALILNLLRNSAGSREATDLVRILVNTVEAHYAFATCAPDTSRDKAFEALHIAGESGIRLWDTHNYGHALAAALTKGDEKLIAQLVPKMSEGVSGGRSVDKAYFHWLMAWRAALHGQYHTSERHLELALKLVTEIGFLAPQTAVLINMAEVYLEMGDPSRAAAYLEKAYPAVTTMGSAYLSFCYLITESTLHSHRGDDAPAVECLRTAFALGRENRIENFYFWRPEFMTRLCTRALEAGIQEEYARALIRKRGLTPHTPPLHVENWPWLFRIYTLGQFELMKDSDTVTFSGKVQKKPLEILKVLVALGGEESREGQVADFLWPEADGDTLTQNLKVTLHRLREILGGGAVLVKEGRLCLNKRLLWIDAQAFEHLLTSAQQEGAKGNEAEAIRLTEKALSLYKGQFLPGEIDRPWAVSLRKRLKSRFVLTIIALAGMWLGKGEYRRAIECYLRGLEVDDMAEELYQRLMTCYHASGLRAEAVSLYRRCRLTLSAHGLKPTKRTHEIYCSLAND